MAGVTKSTAQNGFHPPGCFTFTWAHGPLHVSCPHSEHPEQAFVLQAHFIFHLAECLLHQPSHLLLARFATAPPSPASGSGNGTRLVECRLEWG